MNNLVKCSINKMKILGQLDRILTIIINNLVNKFNK